MKHHNERIRHLRQLEASLDRQIADAQQLQRGHKLAAGGPPPEKAAAGEQAGGGDPSNPRRTRKRR